MPAGTKTAASPLRAWGTSQHGHPCYGFFLPYLVDGINLLRCTKSVLPFIAFQCLAQRLTQYLFVLSKDLLNKELGQHPGVVKTSTARGGDRSPPGSHLSPRLEWGCVGCVCVGGVCVCLSTFAWVCVHSVSVCICPHALTVFSTHVFLSGLGQPGAHHHTALRAWAVALRCPASADTNLDALPH